MKKFGMKRNKATRDGNYRREFTVTTGKVVHF